MARRLFSACAALAAAALACTAHGGTTTFSNAAAITIPGAGTSGNASAFPSAIVVAGLTDPVGLVRVRLIGLSHTNPDDIDILLVGPTGIQVRLMSDCGGSDDVSGIDLVFDDSFPALPNASQIAAGTYNPTNFGAGNDGFVGTLNGSLGAFRGTNGNGTWNLYIVDDSTNEVGSLSGGWELEILDSICVTTTANAGPGSLRQAITDANANAGPDAICFQIPTTDPNYNAIDGNWRIAPTSALPTLSSQITIDGLTQPGSSHATWPPTLNIILDGTSAGGGTHGLNLDASSDFSLIRGLVIQNFGGRGINLDNADDCKIQCNFIGTNVAGTAAAGNGSDGIRIQNNADDNFIGVDGDGVDDDKERNLISGNGSDGVEIEDEDSSRNTVAGNYIGTNAAGDAAVPNADAGVHLDDSGDHVIGTNGDGVSDELEGNLISGNGDTENESDAGILVSQSSGCVVAGNRVGVAADGVTALPNIADGICVSGTDSNPANNNRIGTNADGVSDELERNIFSGNGDDGVDLGASTGAFAQGNRVMGNFIGVGTDGTTPVPNGEQGVDIEGDDVDNNFIGFDQPGADSPSKGNLIAHNTEQGVVIRGTTLTNAAQGNWIRGNSIHSNGGLGIDLGADGVTLNDDGDGDNGANEFKNFPVITSIVGTMVEGTYNSVANRTYDIDVYQNTSADPTGYGEGESYLGSTTVTTDGSGNGTWNLNVVFRGATVFISTVATDRELSRGSSEFSLVQSATVGLDCELTCQNITVPSDAEICETDVDFGEIVSQECLDAGYFLECTIDDGMGGTTPVSSGSPFPVGTTTVTCILRDPLGNEVDQCMFDVTVTTVDMPTLLCPDNIVTTTDAGICGASVSFMTSVQEPCDSGPGLYGLVCTANGVEVLSGDVFPVGVTTVECCIYPTSLGGNGQVPPIDCCTFTVTVTDDEPPVTSCLQDAQVLVSGCEPIVLTADDVLAGGLAGITDNCCTDGFIVNISPDTFTCPPLGLSETINVSVMDCNGNTYTCTLQVEFVGPDCNNNGQSDYCDVCSGFSLDCNDNWVPDECECYWCNGEPPTPKLTFATEDGQLSHIGGGAPDGAKVADDFYLEPGCAHRISAFRGKLLNNSLPQLRKARLEFFEDCNGKPAAEPFASFLSTEFAEIIDVVPAEDGFYALTYRFDLCEECLWLEGGKTYWVSLIGLSDNINNDLSFWLAHEDYIPLLGSIPCKADGTRISWTQWTFGDWMSIEECCLGCVNMDFCLDGYRCPIIWENGKPDLAAGRGGSASGAHQAGETRTADSFVIKPNCVEQITLGAPETPLLCRGGEEICLIEAWIWTNCDPVHGFIELYRDLPCGPPELENTPFVVYSGDQIEATRFNETWMANGQTHRLWRLRVKEPNLTLCAGTNYWISAGAYSTGSFVVNSYFANAAPKCNPCATPHTWRITPGQYRSIRAQSTEWADVNPKRDFAFRIAKRDPNAILTDTIGNPDDDDATPACIADANLDGSVTVDDIFSFLAAWFSGCP